MYSIRTNCVDIYISYNIIVQHHFIGRAICRWGILKLCNDSGVSVSESMAAARHDSIRQHWKYITQDNASEVNRLKAMGFAQD